MNIIFFDDDKVFLQYYRKTMLELSYTNDCYFYSDVINVKRHVSFHQSPALYFLDIMAKNREEGFALAEWIIAQNAENIIIFVTGYIEHIQQNTRQKLLASNVIYKSSTILKSELDISISYAQSHIAKTHIQYKMGYSDLCRIPIDKIVFVETIKRKNKLEIHCTNGRYIVQDTLSSLDAKLANFPYIYRCHSSFIANMTHAIAIDKRQRSIRFTGDLLCYYSRLREKELILRWKKFGSIYTIT